MRKNVAAVCVVVAFIVARPAAAYEWDEHSVSSRDALRVALWAFERNGGSLSAADRDVVEALITGKRAGGDVPITYGDTVAIVDNLADPLKLFEFQSSASRYAKLGRVTRSAATLTAPATLPARFEDLDAFLLRRTLRRYDVARRAATNNDAHFQDELLVNLRYWHTSALDAAARQHKLLGALLLNAIADHYLQDAFAPGHLVTPRYGMHDAAALAMHDYYNISSATDAEFEKAPGWPGDLGVIIDVMSMHADELSLPRACIDELRTPAPIRTFGDGELFAHPRLRALVVAMTARSILDVFESLGDKRNDSFEGAAWHPSEFKPAPSARPASIDTRYGTLDTHFGGDVLVFVPVLGLSTGTESLFLEHGQKTRAVVDADMLLAGNPGMMPDERLVWRPSMWSVGWAAGFTYARDRDEVARGFRLRGIYPISLMHTQFSIDVTRRHYSGRNAGAHGYGWNVRAASGFSLLTFDFAAGRDHALDDAGKLSRAWLLRAGVSLVAPVSRIPLLKNVFHRVMTHGQPAEVCRSN